jgi:hypothetical protein
MSNIQNNRLNLTLTPVQQTDAQQHFADLRALFPFFIGLTSSEKKSMNGINVSNKQWVEDCINEMEQDPSLLPGFITPLQVKTDLQLFEDLEVVKVEAMDFYDRVSYTQFLAGAEAYSVCLIYYRILEAAAKAGMPGADERYNRLKERFMQQPEPSTPQPPTGGGTEPAPAPISTPPPTP